MESHDIYSIGWNCKHQLEYAQNTIKYATNTNNNEVKVTVCDMNNNKMEFKKKGFCSRCRRYRTKENFIEGTCIDYNNGERWEGDSFKGEPFGFGYFYDENNRLVYCGYMFQSIHKITTILNRVRFGIILFSITHLLSLKHISTIQ